MVYQYIDVDSLQLPSLRVPFGEQFNHVNMVNVAVKVHVPPSTRFLLLGVYSSHFDENDEFRHAPHVQHDE